MSKAFTKESNEESDEPDHAAEAAEHAPLAGVKNYITPNGLQRLRDELRFLLTVVEPGQNSTLHDAVADIGPKFDQYAGYLEAYL